MPAWQFTLVIFGGYFFVNLIFTALYLVVGTGGLTGIKNVSGFGRLLEVFFFSTETFSNRRDTDGQPDWDRASMSSPRLESREWLLALAVATGLIYGRGLRKAEVIFDL